MSAFLLDVNVLIALVWPAHESHASVQKWFRRHSQQGWATCPFTEAAFVRILSNPAFSRDALTPREATKLLQGNLRLRSHRFWSDEIGFAEATEPFRQQIIGHRQISDAYLLGLAMHKNGSLATLDRSLLSLLPESSPHRARVDLIPQNSLENLRSVPAPEL